MMAWPTTLLHRQPVWSKGMFSESVTYPEAPLKRKMNLLIPGFAPVPFYIGYCARCFMELGQNTTNFARIARRMTIITRCKLRYLTGVRLLACSLAQHLLFICLGFVYLIALFSSRLSSFLFVP
jgi:hypothetical protein